MALNMAFLDSSGVQKLFPCVSFLSSPRVPLYCWQSLCCSFCGFWIVQKSCILSSFSMLTSWGRSLWDGGMWERESSGETTMLCPGEMNSSSLWKTGNLEVTPLGSEQAHGLLCPQVLVPVGSWWALPWRPCLLSLQREPSIDLLQAFVEHWKGITHYYIESTGKPAAPQPGTQGGSWGEGAERDHRCIGKVTSGAGPQDISGLSQGDRWGQDQEPQPSPVFMVKLLVLL